jgi:hypothetical protein
MDSFIVTRQGGKEFLIRKDVFSQELLSAADNSQAIHPEELEAFDALSALRLVTLNTQGHLIYADSTNIDHAYRVCGLLLQSVAAGATASPLIEGIVTDLSWNWDLSREIFLGQEGYLTQTPLDVGFLLPVARPLQVNQIHFQILETVLL